MSAAEIGNSSILEKKKTSTSGLSACLHGRRDKASALQCLGYLSVCMAGETKHLHYNAWAICLFAWQARQSICITMPGLSVCLHGRRDKASALQCLGYLSVCMAGETKHLHYNAWAICLFAWQARQSICITMPGLSVCLHGRRDKASALQCLGYLSVCMAGETKHLHYNAWAICLFAWQARQSICITMLTPWTIFNIIRVCLQNQSPAQHSRSCQWWDGLGWS